MEITPLSESEKVALDEQIEKLKGEVYAAKKCFDVLSDRLNELLVKRYPERQAEYIKDTLYEAYCRSNKSLELIISYMLNENLDDKGVYWLHEEGL